MKLLTILQGIYILVIILYTSEVIQGRRQFTRFGITLNK